jgi:tetratricopeptide (TPR) repeat protein
LSSERFRWLEFDDERPEAAEAPPREGDRDAFWHLQEARRLYLEGEYEPALRHYSAALKEERALAEAWAGQVRSLLALGELKEARLWAEKAAGLFPGSLLLESARALALARAGLTEEALRASDRAIELAERSQSQEPQVWLDRAGCLFALGSSQTARACIEKVRELAPADDPDWAQRIGIEYLEAGEAALAMKELQAALDRRPDRAYLWYLCARAAHQLRLSSKARFALDKALALKRPFPEAEELQKKLARPCWIASEVYADPEHPAVVVLRRWRDGVWMASGPGRLAAGLYHLLAPAGCWILRHWPPGRRLARWLLDGLVGRLRRKETPCGPQA